jgi:hypothetical protein
VVGSRAEVLSPSVAKVVVAVPQVPRELEVVKLTQGSWTLALPDWSEGGRPTVAGL